MATINASPLDLMKEWAEEQSRSGRYSNTSNCVRDLIRRDQERQQAVAALQQAVDEGLASGLPEPFDAEAFLAEKNAGLARAKA